jgi:rhodanese-related sulfurtransferase
LKSSRRNNREGAGASFPKGVGLRWKALGSGSQEEAEQKSDCACSQRVGREEFIFIGHADMVRNLPVAAQTYQWDAEKKYFRMQALPDFVSRVKEVAKPDDTLMVMCRSGGRSALAVNALGQAGFKNVYNITDGMEGDAVKDPDSVFRGQRLVNGWKNSGLPWTYQIDPERMVLPPDR